jgi:hypothetical protein
MKKITTLIFALFITIATFSQSKFNAYRTEIYSLQNNTWKLSSTNEDVDIPIHIYKRFIHIQAKDNAYFLVDDESVDISGNSFKGNSYEAYEFVTETKCTIHAVDFKNGESMLSITWFEDKINLRYYVKKLK